MHLRIKLACILGISLFLLICTRFYRNKSTTISFKGNIPIGKGYDSLLQKYSSGWITATKQKYLKNICKTTTTPNTSHTLNMNNSSTIYQVHNGPSNLDSSSSVHVKKQTENSSIPSHGQSKEQVCNDIQKPQKSTYGPSPEWHFYSRKDVTIFLHSAFYDDRPNNGLPSLKLLTVSDLEKVKTVYCHVWFNGTSDPDVILAKHIKNTGWKRTIPNVIYNYVKSKGWFEEYVLSCQLPKANHVPDQVSLVTEKCEQPEVITKVIIPEKPASQIDFGVCVAISFGKMNLTFLVEWFEIHKLLGVKQFNIYNASMDSNTWAVLDYYQSTKQLILHQMKPVIPHTDRLSALLNSMPSLNHCFYTNMYTYKQVIIVDYDEVIVPRDHISYFELMKQINAKYSPEDTWASYIFPNVYFFIDVPPVDTKPEYLPKISHRLRNATSPAMYTPKSFIHPMNCEVAFNHHCLKGFQRTGNKPVSPNIAQNHHYRKCSFPKNVIHFGKCEEYKQLLVPDDTMLRYFNALDKNVREILISLKLI